MKVFLIFLLVLLLISVGVYAAYAFGLARFNYPSLEDYPEQGIDVSHHQGAIRWNEIPKERVKFVFIKATEGGDWKDKRFKENWDGAREAGFEVGAYHFFTLCKDGITQARNFMQDVPTGVDFPPVIDLEYVGNCAERPSKENFLRELNDFVQEWQVYYMKKPILYTTHAFYKDYLEGSDYEDYPLWIRDVFFAPNRGDYPSMIYWQYADNARIEGIDGPVDLNVRITQK